jgi:hypothetical protein
VGDESGDFVPETLGRDDSDLSAYLLVGVEVKSEARVVFFDDQPRGLLNCLGTNATLHIPTKSSVRLAKIVAGKRKEKGLQVAKGERGE